jgi:hypothetical protein
VRIQIKIFLFLFFVYSITFGVSNDENWPILKGPYLGQNSPARIAEIFGPGVISTQHREHGITLNPQGDEIYFTRRISKEQGNRIYYMRMDKGRWSNPVLAPFAKFCRESSPNFSPDGNRLFFNSRRPLPENVESPHQMNVWLVKRKGAGWGESRMVGSPIMEFFPMFVTQANSGWIYFTGNVDRGIYRALSKRDTFEGVQRLPDVINSRHWAGHPFIDPQERFLIFDSNVDKKGTKNLYISFRDRKGQWIESINMNQKLQLPEHAAIAHVSFDGRFLFFSSNGDIYWMDARVIDDLKPKR